MRSNYLFMLLAGVLLGGALVASSAHAAAISYDPYADKVAAVGMAASTTNAQRAVGDPDGAYATVRGNGNFITLDMGEGEEGTGSLRLYFGALSASTEVRVTFLDGTMQEIKTLDGPTLTVLSPSTQDFPFRFADENKAYRFVRIATRNASGFTLDGVVASAYIGSSETVDTDGDGIADRTEQRNGTDPQVVTPNTPPATPDTTAPVIRNVGAIQISPTSEQVFWITDEPATSQVQYGEGTRPILGTGVDARLVTNHNVTLTGLSPATEYSFKVFSHDQAGNGSTSGTVYFFTQAAPPPVSRDVDRDGMDDQWEIRYNLNPRDGSDASADADSDGLTNLQEYQAGSDPANADTDNDGMPDGWEKDHNLILTRNDAGDDADGDGTSNVAEYQNGTDPHHFDEAATPAEPTATSTTTDTSNNWIWWLLGAVVLVVILASAMRRRDSSTTTTS